MHGRTVVRSTVTVLLGLLLVSSPLAAQSEAALLTGITVTGYGTASTPADRATIVLELSDSNYGPPIAQPGATPGASQRKAASPAVASLVTAGLIETEIEVMTGPTVAGFGGYGGPAVALLRFSIDDPSPERISELIDAATVGAADERLIVGRVGVLYEVEDCSTLLRGARENALADAHERASLQADLMDVSLGLITGSRDIRPESEILLLYGVPLATSFCAPDYEALNRSMPFNLPAFNPTAPAEVTLTMALDVSFEIEVGLGATPVS